MSDMTLTMTFKAVDEATAVMKTIMEAEREMQASISAGAEASSAGAAEAIVAAERQVAAIDHVAEAARNTAGVIIESVAEATSASQAAQGDRQWSPVEWAADTPEQVAARDDIQNLRDLADQQRMFREFEGFTQELIDGLGGVVPDAVANAITPPEPEPPAWSDRTFGPIEWNDDTPAQAAAREEIRMMRAFADEVQAAEALQRQLAPLADTANEIADAMGGISSNGETAAGALGAVGEAAVDAAPGLANIVAEAMKADGMMQEFGRAFGRIVGSLGSALLVTGVEYAASQMIGFVHEALTSEQQIATALKNHASLVKDIDAAYRAAKDGMSEYEAASASINAWRAERSIVDLNAALEAQRSNIRGEGVFNPLYESVGLNPWDLDGFFGRDLGPLRAPIERYRRGEIDEVQLLSDIGEIGRALPEDSRHQQQIAEAYDRLKPLLETRSKIEDAEKARAKAQEMLAMTGQVQRSAEAGGDPQVDAGAAVLAGADISTPGARDASVAVASGAEAAETSPPIAAAAIEDGAVAAAALSFSALTQEASDAEAELGQVAQVTAEVEPVMRASATGIDFATSGFSLLDPAASGAASSVDSSADAIVRAGQSAEQAAGQLLQLQEAMQSVSAARMSMTPITAGIASQPAPANQNLPGYSGGGYTGDLPEDEIAGFVHGREFVVDAEATAIIGAERLAAIAANPEMLASARPMGGYGRQVAAAMAIAASLALPMQAAASTAELAEMDFSASEQISDFHASDDRRGYVAELASVMEIGRTIMAAAPDATRSLSSSMVSPFAGLPMAANGFPVAPAGEALASTEASRAVETITAIMVAASELSSVALPAAGLSAVAAPDIAYPRDDEVRMEVAGASPMAGGDTNTISVQVSAPVSITGDTSRTNIEAEIAAAMEKSGRQLADIIDEELRRRSRRQH